MGVLENTVYSDQASLRVLEGLYKGILLPTFKLLMTKTHMYILLCTKFRCAGPCNFIPK